MSFMAACRWPQVSHTKVQEVLRAALLAVNDEFLSKASLTEDQSGSTAVAALRVGHQYVVGHVGDSRALLCQHNNTVLGNDTQSEESLMLLLIAQKHDTCSGHQSCKPKYDLCCRIALQTQLCSCWGFRQEHGIDTYMGPHSCKEG
jgi:hypothetical protein